MAAAGVHSTLTVYRASCGSTSFSPRWDLHWSVLSSQGSREEAAALRVLHLRLAKGDHGSATRTNPSKGNSWAYDKEAGGEPPDFYFQTKVTIPHFLEDESYASQCFISPPWLPCFGGRSTEPIEFHIQEAHSKSSSKTQFPFIKLWRKGKFLGENGWV